MACILVVDDDPAIRAFICEALEVEGYTVVAAAHGAAGVQLARDLTPDLILMDLMMPVLDGPSAIQALRADPTTAGICLVAMSAGVTMRAQYEHLAVDGLLLKPFDIAGLYAQVAWCLQRAQNAQSAGGSANP
jgi:CheY-like chemotaxis protein